MTANKISDEEICDLKVASLPTRPTEDSAYSGEGYGPEEMKAAFDRLPLFIIERYNALIDDIAGIGEESLAAAMKTGIKEGHTLCDMYTDISNGNFASYLSVGGESLSSVIARILIAIGENE
ncbi:MAG: hypothetical protein IJX92_04400 [Clostridia bacterium]|nr:hypothetical protein [Clostridia bacterium]